MDKKSIVPASKTVIRTKRRARIDLHDVKEMARLVALRLSEVEAAALLDLNVDTWYRWRRRHRNDTRYALALTRARASRINSNLAEMQKAAGGKEGVRHDWRAADRLNQILKPEVYLPSQQATEPARAPAMNPSVVNVWIELAQELIKPPQPTGDVIEITEAKPKALPESTPEPALEIEIKRGPGMDYWLQAGDTPTPEPEDAKTRKAPPMLTEKNNPPSALKNDL